ncbi:MAG TPA: cytochrome c [Thermoanaerobaculia bacterium]|jgi:mono/diheme cytochrome c family protein|nr:cytochrome c [Thermoanaerobaculia bacterium]
MSYRRLLPIAISITFLTLGASAAFAADAPGAVEIYKTRCASCHGPDGAGQTPAGKAMKVRDLRSAEVQKQTDADLQKSISDGKGKMPAYKTKISVADVASLVAYIRGLAKK